MADRTTKFLLVVIALALWGLLLRPAATPIPTQAQDGGGGISGGMVVTNQDVYMRVGTFIYRFDRPLHPKDWASQDVGGGQAKYVHHGP
jgi:hypothetical protein